MATLLYGVSQHDSRTSTAVAAIMLGVGIVSTLVPAYRAVRVDPLATLRGEWDSGTSSTEPICRRGRWRVSLGGRC